MGYKRHRKLKPKTAPHSAKPQPFLPPVQKTRILQEVGVAKKKKKLKISKQLNK